MKVLIVEDEPFSAEKLKRQLLRIDPALEVLDVLDSVHSTVEALRQGCAPDIIFLDIHLADGDSFEIFEHIETDIPIIFTTAYDEYAIQAFKHNSIDYLLKPIAQEQLQLAMDKFQRLNGKKDPSFQKTLAQSLLQGQPPYQRRFLVVRGEQLLSIAIEQIAYFFADAKYVFLVDSSGGQHIVDKTLEKIEESLNPQLFFRINRKFIVSIPAIGKMTAWSKSRIKIDLIPACATEAVVSTERCREFKEWLNC